MSGGSYSYVYCRVEEECVNRMFDSQLNEMMKDLVDVLHDLERCNRVIVVKKDIAIQSGNSKRNGLNKLRLMLGAICGLIVCSCAMVSQITSLENMITAQSMEIMDLKNNVNKEYLYDDFDETK